MLNTNISRIPRPKGTTLLCMSHFHSDNKSNVSLKQIHRHLLNQYFLNNQQLNGTYYSVDQIAEYLNIPTIEVIRYMHKHLGYLQGFGNANLEDIQGQLREIIFRAAKNALNHSQEADIQYVTLKNAQQNTYKPFVTAEVNRALSNLFAADQNLMAFIRLAAPAAGPPGTDPNRGSSAYSPFFQRPQGPQAEGAQYLTTEAAVALLEDRNTALLGDEEKKATLYLQHRISDMPEVRSNYQTTSVQDTVSVQDTDSEVIVDKHIDRREKGYEDMDEIN